MDFVRQTGGTAYDNIARSSYTKVRTTTKGMIAGVAYAARIGYFGERNNLQRPRITE